MSDNYVECLVKTKRRWFFQLLFWLFAALAVVLFFSMVVVGVLGFLMAILCALLAYVVWMQTELEYEYLFIEQELSVDKVMAKSKRKKIDTFIASRIEIIAPIHSHHLDEYKNRQVKVKDYSVGKEENPDMRYVMFYEGRDKVILNPSEDLLKAIKNVAPRKVFTD